MGVMVMCCRPLRAKHCPTLCLATCGRIAATIAPPQHNPMTIASSWKSPSDPSRWCKSSLDIWKHRVETEWRFELLKMRSKLVEYENVSPHPTKCDFTINIPLYNLLLGREVQSIRIRRARNTKNGRPYLLITFPGAIFADNKMRRKSMKSRFGRDSQWASFIEGFLKGAVYQWKTIEDARVWYVKSGFVHQVNRLWEIKLKKNLSQRGSSVVADRTWTPLTHDIHTYVDRSKIMFLLRDEASAVDLGFGYLTTKITKIFH